MKRRRVLVDRPDAARAQDLMRGRALSREKACSKKHPYSTRSEARHAAKLAARRNDRPFATYHCEYCGKWHLTKFKHGEYGE